jgi:hypothetical protein
VGTIAIFLEMLAGDVDHDVGVEVFAIIPQARELHAFGVPEQPRGFVVEGGIVEGADMERDPEGAAVPAQAATGRGLRHGGSVFPCSGV